jgi:hypothetical protein
MGHREALYIPIMHDHLEAQLGRSLRRLDERSHSGPSHDFETLDGVTPVIAIEAKELVSADFLATSSQVGRARSYESKILQLHWMVSYSEPALGSSYDPKTWELSVRGKLAQISLGKLFAKLEKHLLVLEQFGVTKSRSRDLGTAALTADVQAVAEARFAISALVNGVCLGSNPNEDHPPGIDVAFSYSYVRTGFPDAVVERIQSWLDSPFSGNLLESLQRTSAGERHAALWLASDPEADSASEQGLDFKPTTHLAMPESIDILWAFVPPVVWRYDGQWSISVIAGRQP